MEKDIFMRVLLSEKIKLEPKYLSKGFKNDIYKKLCNKLEGVCTRHGYIKKGSVEIFKMAPGVIDIISLNGFIVFNVHFYADVCNPTLGSIIKARVTNTNKFGILSESGYYDEESKDNINILEIITAKNSINIQSDIDLDNIVIGQEVFIEILGKKYELGDKKISIVGRIVNDSKPSKVYKKPVAAAIAVVDDKENEEEVEPDDEAVVDGEGDEDEEEDEGSDNDEESEAEEAEADEADEVDVDVDVEGDEDEKSSKVGGLFSDDDDLFYDEDEYDEMFDEDNENDNENEDEYD